MEVKEFVNEFISIGMNDYFYVSNGTSFERHIVECLCDIYGQEEIKKLYDDGNVDGFNEMIIKFGVKPEVYDNFLRSTVRFELFKKENEKNPAIKSDIASNIEENIITMFLRKCVIYSPTEEELSHFENDLLNDFNVIKWHFNTSINPNKTRDIWNTKRKILSEEVELVEIKPVYLDEFTYSRFGVKLDDVKKMDGRMVDELNKYIKGKLEEDSNMEDIELPKIKKKTSVWNTAISSGNGYVDALMIVSIIVTELSIGAIYLFLHM